MDNTQYDKKIRETDEIIEFAVTVPINVTQIALEVFQNCPEASISMPCIKYEYGFKDRVNQIGEQDPSLFCFIFTDPEDDDHDYEVTIEMAAKGVSKVIEGVLAGKLHLSGMNSITDLLDTGNWDAECVDAAIQFAIFGEIIYG